VAVGNDNLPGALSRDRRRDFSAAETYVGSYDVLAEVRKLSGGCPSDASVHGI
jgi:hypothetical protein